MSTDTMNCWEQILVILEQKVGSQNFSIWLRPTNFSHQDHGTLFVSVPNATCKDWITEHYTDEIREAISGLSLPVSRIEFVTGGQEAPVAPAPSAKILEIPGPRGTQDSGVSGSKLNERYTFENYVVRSEERRVGKECRL